MKNITSPKNDFLLQAPIEVLHSESMEWLDEIELWKDESAFFYTLIIEETKKNPSVFKTQESKDVEKHIVYLSAEKIDDLKIEIESHEKFLSRLLDNPHLDQQLYRSRHKAITEKVHAFENEIKEMKKKIFGLAKKARQKETHIA